MSSDRFQPDYFLQPSRTGRHVQSGSRIQTTGNPQTPAVATPGVNAERIRHYTEQAKAKSTRRAYLSDWKRFDAWCTEHSHVSVPVRPDVLADYLTEAAAEKLASGAYKYATATISRWLSTINIRHRAAGYLAPIMHEGVQETIQGIRNVRGTRQRRVAPLMVADLRHLMDDMATPAWPLALTARRDAAMLLVGFAAAFRRSELAALSVADVKPDRADGIHLWMAKSKDDQEASGRVKAIPYGRDPATCTPCALWRWMEIIDLADAAADDGTLRVELMRLTGSDGHSATHICRDGHPYRPNDTRPLFRPITKSGLIGERALSGHGVNAIIKRRVESLGMNPDMFAGHSLRSGFVTEAFRAGADSRAIRRQTWHKGDAILAVYDREHAPMVNNAVTGLGL